MGVGELAFTRSTLLVARRLEPQTSHSPWADERGTAVLAAGLLLGWLLLATPVGKQSGDECVEAPPPPPPQPPPARADVDRWLRSGEQP